MTELQHTTWIGIVTRLATVRVLEIRHENEMLVRYRAREDAALRAGIEVLAPGAQPVSVLPSDVRKLRTSRAPTPARAAATR
jgi:carboxyl-terminal processing protease